MVSDANIDSQPAGEHHTAMPSTLAQRITAELAGKIMQGRQAGVPLEDMAGDGQGGGGKLRERLALAAYSTQRFETPQAQERAVAEFRDEAYGACLAQ